MKRLLIVAVATCVVSGFLLGQATPKPVPEEWLRDGKLVVPEFNFSVNSPSPQSRWTYTEMNTRGKSSTAFYAATSDVDQLASPVQRVPSVRAAPESEYPFATGWAKTNRRSGPSALAKRNREESG
jgi:hypothetical protein